jgi:ketosteroid isomerase-like protein
MSQENVDAVRSTFEAFQKRDLDAFLDCFDPDVEYRSLVLEVEGTYRGREGMRRWWDGLLDVFPDWNPQIVDSREVGRCVVSRVRAEGRGTGSGISRDKDIWHVAQVRDGRLWWSVFLRTEAEALEVARLRE